MLDLPKPPTWTEQAVCAEVDPAMWHPEDGEHGRAAKAICRTCPVREQCLAYALEHQDPHGIYGGLNYRDRLALLRAVA